MLFSYIPGNKANPIKYPPIIPPKCPNISTSDPNENNIEKNTKNPTVQHICDLIYPYCPKVCQLIVIYAKYEPITPNIIPDAPALIVNCLLQSTDKIFP